MGAQFAISDATLRKILNNKFWKVRKVAKIAFLLIFDILGYPRKKATARKWQLFSFLFQRDVT